MDPEARQRRLLGVDQAPEPRRERARAGRHGVRGPALARPGERGRSSPTRSRRSRGRAASSSSTSGPSTTPPGCRGPTTARSRSLRSAPRRSRQLLADLLGSDPSLDGLAELIRERTEGNPFFIEELVQALVEAGSLEGERGAYRLVRPVERGRGAGQRAGRARRADRPARRSARRRCCRRRR